MATGAKGIPLFPYSFPLWTLVISPSWRHTALRQLLHDALSLIDREIDAMEAGFAAFERDMMPLEED